MVAGTLKVLTGGIGLVRCGAATGTGAAVGAWITGGGVGGGAAACGCVGAG